MNYCLILSLWLLISVLSGCCIQVLNSQTINQELGTFVPVNAVYEGSDTIQSNGSIIVYRKAIILFSDGSLVTKSLSEFDDLIKEIQNSKRFRLYGGGSSFKWGKYFISSDTIHIEHIVDINSGGGFCRFRSYRYYGLVSNDRLEIFPGPERLYNNEGVTRFIYPQDGILCLYTGTVTNDVIDPSKAKFRR